MERSKLRIISLGFLSVLLAINAFSRSSQERIRFARGENSATVSGSVGRGANVRYLIGGREGQKMSVKISAEKSAAFEIRDAANESFIGGGANDWGGVLPTTGDYEISVSGDASYKLTVTVK